MVATPTGEVAIQVLKVGDAVLAFDHALGRAVTSTVTDTFVHHDQKYKQVQLPNGETLGITANHPVYANDADEYLAASDLRAGQALTMLGSPINTSETAFRTTIKALDSGLAWLGGEHATVYNISVKGHENYFAEGLLVHNKSVPCFPENGCYQDAGMDAGRDTSTDAGGNAGLDGGLTEAPIN